MITMRRRLPQEESELPLTSTPPDRHFARRSEMQPSLLGRASTLPRNFGRSTLAWLCEKEIIPGVESGTVDVEPIVVRGDDTGSVRALAAIVNRLRSAALIASRLLDAIPGSSRRELRFASWLLLLIVLLALSASIASTWFAEAPVFERPWTANRLELPCTRVSVRDMTSTRDARLRLIALMNVELQERRLPCITSKHVNSSACVMILPRDGALVRTDAVLYNPYLDETFDGTTRDSGDAEYAETSDFFEGCSFKTRRPAEARLLFDGWDPVSGDLTNSSIVVTGRTALCGLHMLEVLDGSHARRCRIQASLAATATVGRDDDKDRSPSREESRSFLTRMRTHAKATEPDETARPTATMH
jgi:hypothetical protein